MRVRTDGVCASFVEYCPAPRECLLYLKVFSTDNH